MLDYLTEKYREKSQTFRFVCANLETGIAVEVNILGNIFLNLKFSRCHLQVLFNKLSPCWPRKIRLSVHMMTNCPEILWISRCKPF